jgi:hypothetical protein
MSTITSSADRNGGGVKGVTGRATVRWTVKWISVAALGGVCLGFGLAEILVSGRVTFQSVKYTCAGAILIGIVTYKISKD